MPPSAGIVLFMIQNSRIALIRGRKGRVMRVGNENESGGSSRRNSGTSCPHNQLGKGKLQNMKHNDDSALRLIGALLAEQNEVWQEHRSGYGPIRAVCWRTRHHR